MTMTKNTLLVDEITPLLKKSFQNFLQAMAFVKCPFILWSTEKNLKTQRNAH